MVGFRKLLCTWGVAASQVIGALGIVTGDVATTILILARTQYDADQASSGFEGYGIPFQTVIVPQGGITLPVLNSTATKGNYGGILTVSELSYLYDDWRSAITDAQWAQLYAYQKNFGVRMVRIDAWPQDAFGTAVAVGSDGCCDSGVEQRVSLTNDTTFKTANLKLNQGVSTIGLWHVPAVITNPSIATKFAEFEPSGQWTTTTVAGVINRISGREQMVWFTTWATDWALGPNYLQHASIHFLTRGLFVGARKIRFNTQIDDVMLDTEIYQSTERFRIRIGDLEAHKDWMSNINGRMPTGSNYFLELAHNGAGDLEVANQNDPNDNICTPDTYVLTGSPPTVPPTEFVKPLGTGTSYWKSGYNMYTWSQVCAKLDPLTNWFTINGNKNAFSHLSHTFTHLHLSNATYSDTNKEIQFNQQWMASIGLNTANKFSPNGLVPPAISGLHNGDAIRAFLNNGIKYVVGDNTRSLLRNTQSEYWPIVTTVANDGYAGLTIIPRWATSIFYNCYSAECTTAQWIATSGGSGDFANLLRDAKNVNVKNLLSLHQDPFMFHQANLRQIDMPDFTVGSVTGKMSLVQIWVETVVQELVRLTNWPIVTLKHDDLAKVFIDRKTRDLCNPKGSYKITSSGTITGLVLTANSNSCGVPIPVTAPGSSSVSSGGSTLDQVGTEPPIRWVTLNGLAKTVTLSTPISGLNF
ncbi:hypothetical protein V8F06_006940 [Rhypophila decipiens]